ncbi:hypothetical protein L4D76_01615 [Photobacterium sagamiensis]|uniref:hypothetical protein n=1 Tax=Photobacterium sagamiensis TaxID=2910241 RepID=UPI003D0C08B4
MSSPFTIHEHNKELSNEIPKLLNWLYQYQNEQCINFFDEIIDSGFLQTLHFDCLSLYPKMLSFDLPLRPALYYDYADIDEKDKLPARVSTADFESCNNLYKDLSEVFSRQLVLIAGLNNLLKRGDANLFSEQKRFNKHQQPVKAFSSLNNYANVDLGQKLDAIDDSFFAFNQEAIDNQLRNGIAHFKYEYHESTQLITYYPFREGIERVKGVEIQFIEFMRKNLLLFRENHSLNHIIKSLLYYTILILKKDI